MLNSESLQALPRELLVQLRGFLVSARKPEMAAVLEAIGAENAALAEAIARCFHNFECDKVLNFIPRIEESL